MRARGAGLCLSTLIFAAGCSGGGGSVPARSLPAPAPTATSSGAATPRTASVSFTIARPASDSRSGTKRAPSYVGTTTQSITIAISNSNSSAPVTLTATSSCSTCAFTAATALAVVSTPYTFAFTANGNHGALSSGSTSQVIVSGPNVVAITLNPIVATMSLAISGTPNPAGAASQILPVTTQAYDADGNAITGTTPYAIPFPILLSEIDPLAAFSLQPSSSGSALCQPASSSCQLRSNRDSISLAYSPAASTFATEPQYYPEEAILFEDASDVTAANSASVSTPPCTASPICVYAQPLYPLLLAAGSATALGNAGAVLQPIEGISQGSTIYTDSGTITSTGTPPYAFHYNAGPADQTFSGLAYAASTQLAYTVDYSGNTDAGGNNQFLDSIATNGASTPLTYPVDPNTTYSSQGSYGEDIIVGPDGNLWWIDPQSGDLRYASPSNVSSASVCGLQTPSSTLFLTAYQIVATPPGVTPARIWFSAFDQVNSNTFIGYVNVSPNSCNSGQTVMHRIEIARDNAGTLSAPNGMAVDGSGNLWYNSADSTAQDYTSIGEVTADGTGALTQVKPKLLPGALGNAQQDWGLSYDTSDGYLYFAADGGLIGKFLPSAGVASATAYALPLPLAALVDVTGDNNADDSSFCVTAQNGLCLPQFGWDAGSGGAHGRLTFVINDLQTASNNNNQIDPSNAVVQLNLDGGVTFTAMARSRPVLQRHHVSRSKHARRGRTRALPYPFGTI